MERSEHVLLVGLGATRFAREQGIQTCSKDDLIIDRELSRWREIQKKRRYTGREVFSAGQLPGDTVGAVAMDASGNLAAATSTGGVPNKHPGRVGDSPLIGCGTYADSAIGAVSATGWGEALIVAVMAKTVTDLMEHLGLDSPSASERGIGILWKKTKGHGGVITLDSEGRPGIAYNTTRMARGLMTTDHASPQIVV